MYSIYKVDALATDVVGATLHTETFPDGLGGKSEQSARMVASLAYNCSSLSATLRCMFPVMKSLFACKNGDGVSHSPEQTTPQRQRKPV